MERYIFTIGLFIILLISIILIYRLILKLIQLKHNKNIILADTVIRDTHYKEDEIIDHLDYIIKEALEEYITLKITPKKIYYINSAEESKIIKYLSDEVPNRISKTLMMHLSFIYDKDFIGIFLGKHIYMVVLNYVLEFNTNNKINQESKKENV